MNGAAIAGQQGYPVAVAIQGQTDLRTMFL